MDTNSENVNDALTIWRAYCDKKMELEDAQDEIERLRDQIYDSIPKWQANELQREIERLRGSLQKLLDTVDGCKMVERGAGGMTVDAQIRRSVYINVPVMPFEEARNLLMGISDD